MKTRLIYLLSLSVALVLTACSDDDDVTIDTQAPSIEISDPLEGQTITPGGEIHFDALLTDDVELASYKIDVHNAFDGHSHAHQYAGISQVSNDDHSNQDNPWSYNEVYTIEPDQTSFEAHHHIAVPSEIGGRAISQGHYHFGVFVTDAAGNETQAFLELYIGHDNHDHDDHDHGHDH